MSEDVILVVDDNHQNADFIAKHILPSLGFVALTAYGGKAGLQLLQEKHQQISLMLLDLQMPDLDGLGLLKTAKEAGINVPAVMVTAHGSEQVIGDAFRLGVHDYLKKPIDVDQLNLAITRALSEVRLQREKAELTKQLQEQVSWLSALVNVGRSVISTLNIDNVLRRILEAGVSLTKAQQGFIALLDSHSDRLFLRAVKNIEEQKVNSVRIPVNDILIQQALVTGKPVRIDRPTGGDNLRVSTGLLVHSLIHVPMFYQKRLLGVLSVNNHTQPRTFTQNDEIVLRSLADYAAIAIVNANSFEKAKMEIEERKRVETALRIANSEFSQLIASFSSILIVLSPKLQVIHWNPSAQTVFGFSKEDAVGKHIDQLGDVWKNKLITQNIKQCRQDGLPKYLDPVIFKRLDGSDGYLGINISPIFDGDAHLSGFILLGGDITERKILEDQLSQSQKLKSIGQLASGIAHEINTPIQYVGDNTTFIQRSFKDLDKILGIFSKLLQNARSGSVDPGVVYEVDAMIEQVDLDYLREEIPLAIRQSIDGIRRVTQIVRAMREFSHPGVVEKVAMDVNAAIENTLTVSRNEWKYVADVKTNLAPDLPELVCQPVEINQAFLNIIVNAAHAIQEVVKDQSGMKGTIGITTQQDGDWIEIRISDTGTGIPENIQKRIFEPFFTTKEVGKGSGQGLSIAFNAIVRNHGGKLSFHSKIGKGTTFIIRLPIYPSQLTKEVTNIPSLQEI